MTTYKLLALDVDGTLVSESSPVVSSRTARAIHAVAEHIHVVLCTGRDESEMIDIVEQLKLQQQYRILGGGSILISPCGAVERSAGISSSLFNEAYEYVRNHAAESYQLSVEDGWIPWAPERSAMVLSFIGNDHNHALEITQLLTPLSDRMGITQVTAIEDPTRVAVICAPLGTSKGASLSALCKRLGIPKEAVASIGDMPIDISMFDASGLGIAMGNAPSEVKSHAQLVLPSVEEDGVAHFIETHLLGRLS